MNQIAPARRGAVIGEFSEVEAYESIAAELKALPAEAVQSINLDVSTAVAIAFGALPALITFRDQLETLPDFDAVRFDKLEIYALALSHAHSLCQSASQPPDDLKALQEEGSAQRELLYKDVTAAIARGVIPADAIDDLRGANGYKNTANDLRVLVAVLRNHWASLDGRGFTTEEELNYAGKLASHILRVFGVREHGATGLAEVNGMRQRAYSLFVKTYDEARQGIAYLRRRAGDADRIAPSLFSARAAKKKDFSELTPNAPDVSPLPNAA
ncbi:MAG TPA: hypothetical protein VN764_12705, partial [Polyangiaceae bacterium]|nr:hypothetical protein [Polyangiaceae bacterium]